MIFAREMGFCYGVRRAVESALASADDPRGTMTLGPIIHNPQMVAKLQELGVGVTESLEGLDGKKVIIRSHGVGPQIYKEADEKGIEILDATCPHVRKVREAVLEFAREGRRIIIIGEADHPEVQGVKEWAGERAQVVSTVQEAENIPFGDDIGVVAQTTFQNSIFEELVEVIKKKAENVAIRPTICSATELRQQAVRDLCKEVEIVVVVGGKNSGNTKRLAEIAKEEGKRVILVEVAAELDPVDFEGIQVVGVTAGASTPDEIIQSVAYSLENMGSEATKEDIQMENKEINQEEVAISTSMEEKEEAVPVESLSSEPEEKELTMDDMMKEENFGPRIRTHERIKGVVDTVTSDGIFVHIGGKSDGFIPYKELMVPEDKSLEEAFPIGTEVEAMVLQVQNAEGHPVLSQSKIAREQLWNDIQEAVETGGALEGKVSEVIKGGLSVFVKGIRAFVPASQVDLRRVEDLSGYVGKTLEFIPIEVEAAKNRLVLSRRALLKKVEDEKKEAALAKLEVGQVIKGEVKRLSQFGAFVDLGGIDGLIHLSRLSWGHVRKASDVVNEGDQVEVKIIEMDKEKGKISLSLKDMMPDPWIATVKGMKAGDTVHGKVARIAKFGAFVEIALGVDALLPVSEISEEKSEKALEGLEIGQELEAKIIKVDLAQKRISISLRRFKQDKEKAEYQPFLTKDEDKLEVSLGDQFADVLQKINKE